MKGIKNPNLLIISNLFCIETGSIVYRHLYCIPQNVSQSKKKL